MSKRIKQRAIAGVLGKAITRRSKGRCELCEHRDGLQVFELPPFPTEPDLERALLGCQRCRDWLETGKIIPIQAHFLEQAIWSDVAPVRLAAARLLLAQGEWNDPWLGDALEASGVDPATGEFRAEEAQPEL